MALGQGLIEQLKKAQELVKDPTPLLQRTPPPYKYNPVVAEVPTDRAVPAWADEDRIVFQRAVQQINQVRNLYAQVERVADAAIQGRTVMQSSNVPQDFRTLSQLPPSEAERSLPSATRPRQGGLGRALVESAAPIAQSAYNVARTNVPYADRVQEQAGRAGRYFGEEIVPGALVPGGPAVAWALKKIPGADRVAAIPGRAYEEVFKALVPTEVWDTALTLLPAAKAKSVPELLSAITLGDTDALTAIKSAGRKLGKVAEVDGLLEVLAREAGGPGKTPDDLIGAGVRAGEDVVPAASAADVSALPPSPVPELRERIMDRVRMNKPVRLEQEVARSEERSRRAAGVERAFSSRSPDQILKGIDAARRGSFTTAEFEPMAFDQDEWAWILKEIADAPALMGKGYTKANLADAFRRIEKGFGLRDFEDKLITQVFGEDFAAAIRDRGVNTLLRNVIEAWTPKGIDPFSLQEIVPIGQRYTTEAVQQGVDLSTEAALAARNAQPSLEENITGAVTRGAKLFRAPQADRLAQERVVSAVKEALEHPKPLEKLTLFQRALSPVQNWRSFVTAFDNGFLGRQGWRLFATENRLWRRSWRASWRAMASEDVYKAIDEEVKAMSTYDLGQNLKRPLAIVTEGGGSRPTEEFLPKTPRLLRPSERGYVAPSNLIRQGTLENNVKLVMDNNFGHPLAERDLQLLVDNINNATGYGNVDKFKNNLGLLGQTFFSLRNKAALPGFLWDVARAWSPGVDPTVRMIITKRFGGWLALNMSLLYAAKWASAETGLVDAGMNPWDAKTFGKIRIGSQTFDIWGGYAPLVRAVIGVGSGFDGEGPNASAVVGNYTRNQFSPAASVAYDLSFAKGKDYRGTDLYSKDIVGYGARQVSPIFLRDTWEAWKQNGIVGALGGGAASFSGFGTGVLEPPSEDEQQAELKKAAAKELEKQGVPMADGEIDFRQPQLDGQPSGSGPTRRQMIADTLKIKVSGDATLAKMKETYIKEKTPLYMESQGVSKEMAEYELGRAFDNHPVVKPIVDNAKDALLKYWKAHPDLLKQAIDGGLTDASQEKQEILEEAGLY